MSIATEISRLQGAKADIKTAIEGKGVSVPSSALLDSYPDYIDAIQQGGGEHTYTGHVDTAGLTALGWDADDIQWLQDHVWWDAEDDAYWAVTEANLAFGPNGATPLTWANRASIKTNPDVRYFPKLMPTVFSYALNEYYFLVAIPTHGWTTPSGTQSMTYMFSNCINLRSVGDLGALNVSNVTNMSYTFANCSNLITVGDLSTWRPGNVTNFSNMFSRCSSLVSIGDISAWGMSSATNLSSMFYDCVSIKSLGNLSSWNTGLVTNFVGIFSGMRTMRSIVGISSWVVTGMTALSYIFDYVSVDTLDLSGWNLSGLTNSGSAVTTGGFSACYGIARLVLGKDFFAGSSTTFYFDNLRGWTRDSIYESLYTNQTTRNSSSPAKTIRIYRTAYDTLSAADISDIATKNFTLSRI